MAQSDERDVIGILTQDHREVEEIFQRIEGLPHDDHDLRRQLTDQAIAELVRHSVAEEAYLYPATRSTVPGGDSIADKEIAEHAEAEQLMKDLERTDTTDPEFDPKLLTLMSEIREHIQDEENDLFPALRANNDPDALADLGDKVQRMKRLAPTRPHPGAPDTPPAAKILAPGAGLVDRVRDAVSGRPS